MRARVEGFGASNAECIRTAGNVEQTVALGALAEQDAVTLPCRSVVAVVIPGAAAD